MSAAVEDSKRRHVRRGAGSPPHASRHRATANEEPGIAEPSPSPSGQSSSPDPSSRVGSSPLRPPSAADPGHPTTEPTSPGSGSGKPHHHHHVLIEPEEDRWAWRRRIRQNPHKLRAYRIGVGIAGLLLICLGVLTGPLPGPGGIPLVLLGLAIWSSEFEWAYRLRQRFKAEIRKYRGWTPGKKVAFWAVFFAVCLSFGYSYLLVLGVPFWVPDAGASLLDHLPGVETP